MPIAVRNLNRLNRTIVKRIAINPINESRNEKRLK
jgi:hypothetical protein